MAGVGTGEACQRVGITRKTGYRWRAERGGLPPLRVVEEERGPRYLSLLECQRIATLRRTGLGGAGDRPRTGTDAAHKAGWSLVRCTSRQAVSLKRAIRIERTRHSSGEAGECSRGYQPDDELGWCRRSVDHHRKGLTGGEW
jgi:hypothetical protein